MVIAQILHPNVKKRAVANIFERF